MAERHYDLVVIGSGPAGEKGAARAAYEGKKVAMVESASELGGTATSQGVPTKALRETALNISGFLARGIDGVDLQYKDEVDVQTFLYRERHVQAAARNAVAANLVKHGIDLYQGFASFEDPHTLRIDSPSGTVTISGDVILIATGSRPFRPASFRAVSMAWTCSTRTSWTSRLFCTASATFSQQPGMPWLQTW